MNNQQNVVKWLLAQRSQYHSERFGWRYKFTFTLQLCHIFNSVDYSFLLLIFFVLSYPYWLERRVISSSQQMVLLVFIVHDVTTLLDKHPSPNVLAMILRTEVFPTCILSLYYPSISAPQFPECQAWEMETGKSLRAATSGMRSRRANAAICLLSLLTWCQGMSNNQNHVQVIIIKKLILCSTALISVLLWFSRDCSFTNCSIIL